MVRLRTLTPSIEVRILAGHPASPDPSLCCPRRSRFDVGCAACSIHPLFHRFRNQEAAIMASSAALSGGASLAPTAREALAVRQNSVPATQPCDSRRVFLPSIRRLSSSGLRSATMEPDMALDAVIVQSDFWRSRSRSCSGATLVGRYRSLSAAVRIHMRPVGAVRRDGDGADRDVDDQACSLAHFGGLASLDATRPTRSCARYEGRRYWPAIPVL